jgi:hypothetical protein
VPCWLGCFSTSTAHPDLQNRKSTGSSGTACNFVVVFRTGLDTRDRTADLRALELLRTPATLRDALMVVLSITRRAGIIDSYILDFTNSYRLLPKLTRSFLYFRRSAIILSVRRLCRVFAPRVGKPQGVWG